MTVTAAILGIIVFFVSRLFKEWFKKNPLYHGMFWGVVLGAVYVGLINFAVFGHINLLGQIAICTIIAGIIDLLLRKYLEDDDHDVL